MELRERILQVSMGLFYQYGIKSITMDDIARELGISKKTIYQYFKDKDQIVCEVTNTHMVREQSCIQEFNETAKDPIDELVHISKKLRQTFQMMHPSLLFDLKKYHPNAMKYFSKFMEECVLGSVRDNLENGKKMGLYRPEINPDIISKLRIKEAELVFDGNSFPMGQYDLPEVQGQFFDHFMYGIVSDSGNKLLKKYLKT
jgi:AcrR family transcriptional regulator